jgi:25S rRNA (adenine2142-N1)-methyltransferase
MAVKKRQKTLSSGRPPVAQKRERMSSKQSRSIIREHHRLEKDRVAAVKKGDVRLADLLKSKIEKNGGIEVYQAASKQGQSKDRGGDSSRLLVEWLQQGKVINPTPPITTDESETRKAKPARTQKKPNPPYKLLEVGALSTHNAISKFPRIIGVTRIDLNSQGEGIEQQDFMERPLPTSDGERFDIISLSLVVNFVPDPVQRGEMLKRVTQFLRSKTDATDSEDTILPALFLVLPLSCVTNCRYLNEELLLRIMRNLGFELTNKKRTLKLCYYLFKLANEGNGVKTEKKKMMKEGPGMNNFCIVVE